MKDDETYAHVVSMCQVPGVYSVTNLKSILMDDIRDTGQNDSEYQDLIKINESGFSYKSKHSTYSSQPILGG